MSLKTCPDCGHDVSSRAIVCPGCGRAMRTPVRIDTANGCAMIAFGVFCGMVLFSILAVIFGGAAVPLLAGFLMALGNQTDAVSNREPEPASDYQESATTLDELSVQESAKAIHSQFMADQRESENEAGTVLEPDPEPEIELEPLPVAMGTASVTVDPKERDLNQVTVTQLVIVAAYGKEHVFVPGHPLKVLSDEGDYLLCDEGGRQFEIPKVSTDWRADTE